MKICLLIQAVFIVFSIFGDEIAELSLPPVAGMTRADIFYLKSDDIKEPKAILILCPGCNGNGKGYVANPVWQSYAKKMNLGLVGLSFASETAELKEGEGYYYANQGSGQLLLDGLKKIYGKDLPILLYGISGGAHFTARFTEWNEKRVLAWCAYSAAWWDKPVKSQTMPPGIVACGLEDERIDASQRYFWDGREVGKPWLWIEIEGTGHASSKPLESFIRDYFEIILKAEGKVEPFKKGIWMDIYERTPVTFESAKTRPCAAAWLPDKSLMDNWLLFTKGTQK